MLTFIVFLRYVYLGKLHLDKEVALGLFEFAERYMIHDLNFDFEKYFEDILAPNNCFEIFERAYLYEMLSLKKKVLILFNVHLEEISERKDFEGLPKWSYIHLKRIQWQKHIDDYFQSEFEPNSLIKEEDGEKDNEDDYYDEEEEENEEEDDDDEDEDEEEDGEEEEDEDVEQSYYEDSDDY